MAAWVGGVHHPGGVRGLVRHPADSDRAVHRAPSVRAADLAWRLLDKIGYLLVSNCPSVA